MAPAFYFLSVQTLCQPWWYKPMYDSEDTIIPNNVHHNFQRFHQLLFLTTAATAALAYLQSRMSNIFPKHLSQATWFASMVGLSEIVVNYPLRPVKNLQFYYRRPAHPTTALKAAALAGGLAAILALTKIDPHFARTAYLVMIVSLGRFFTAKQIDRYIHSYPIPPEENE